MPDALLLVVIQMRNHHPVAHRQAAGPGALATRLVERIGGQDLRDPLTEIAVVGGIFLAQALPRDGVGHDQLAIGAEQQHTLKHLIAEGAQHGRGRQQRLIEKELGSHGTRQRRGRPNIRRTRDRPCCRMRRGAQATASERPARNTLDWPLAS